MFEHKGIDIEITDRGQFMATVGDVEISQPSLELAKALIDKTLSAKPKRTLALKVVGIQRSSKTVYRGEQEPEGKVAHVTLVSLNRTTRDFQYEGLPKGHKIDSPLPDTPANAKLLERYLAAKEEFDSLNERRQEKMLSVRQYGRIAIEEYDEVVSDLEKAHKENSK